MRTAARLCFKRKLQLDVEERFREMVIAAVQEATGRRLRENGEHESELTLTCIGRFPIYSQIPTDHWIVHWVLRSGLQDARDHNSF